jgi:hypothetical protein
MRRIGIVLVLAMLCTAPGASAQKAIDITPDYIAGIELGMTHAKVRAVFGKLVRADRLESGYDRLVSGTRKVEVYFRKGAKGAVAVTTWNRQLRTAEQIGPCSTVAALKRAYGKKLVPFRQGRKLVAYRLANLIFTVEGGKRIGVVALGRGDAEAYVALNAPACR